MHFVLHYTAFLRFTVENIPALDMSSTMKRKLYLDSCSLLGRTPASGYRCFQLPFKYLSMSGCVCTRLCAPVYACVCFSPNYISLPIQVYCTYRCVGVCVIFQDFFKWDDHMPSFLALRLSANGICVLYACMCACLFVRLPVCLPICLHTCASVCLPAARQSILLICLCPTYIISCRTTRKLLYFDCKS